MGAHDPVDSLSVEELDRLLRSWEDPARPRSAHLDLTIAEAFRRREKGLPVLRGDEPVPGCGCPVCTGIPTDHPARAIPLRSRARRVALGGEAVQAAKRVPLLQIASMLGLGEPRKRGREYVVRCPMHEDERPSLSLNPAKGLWFCGPCGDGGDGIDLVRRVLRCGFPDAVRHLTQDAA
jgi:hypothetical protein